MEMVFIFIIIYLFKHQAYKHVFSWGNGLNTYFPSCTQEGEMRESGKTGLGEKGKKTSREWRMKKESKTEDRGDRREGREK